RVFVVTLLVAGSITTAYLIGNAMHELVGDPALRARVTRDPTLIGRVVEESLRHDAPVQLMFRTATTDVEIAGTTIPCGATVLALMGSANRDDAVLARPADFDIDRAATSDHLAFGHGVHFCLGAALARLEARIALEELLRRAPEITFAGSSDRITSIVFRGPTCLPLRFGEAR